MTVMLSRKVSTLVASAALATTLQACVNSSAIGDLKVGITKECESLRPKKAFPDIREDGDYRHLSADALVALRTAYRQGDRYAACVLRVIEAYARAGQ